MIRKTLKMGGEPLSRRCLRIFGGGISSSSSPFGAAMINQSSIRGGGGWGGVTYRYIIVLFEFDAMRDFKVVYLFEKV